MNTIKYILNILSVKFIWVLLIFLLVNSCTDEFEKYNTNKAVLMEVGPKQLSQLFSSAIQRSTNWLSTDNYNRMSSTMANHFCGYVVCGNGNGTSEENFLNTGWFNTGWSRHYTNIIPTFRSIMDVTKDKDIPAYSIAVIYKVYVMQQLTDLWGPIPYTEAASGKEKVPYESQKDVYYKMFADLTEALKGLNAAVQSNPGLNVYGAGDMIYNGDASKWLRFGNSLRLRMAIRISNIDPDKAKLEGEAAAAGPTLETNDHDAFFPVTTMTSDGNGMPRNQSFGAPDFMSTAMESFMVGYNDPRISEYWSPVISHSTMSAAGYPVELKNNVGGYHGFTMGYPPSQFNYYYASSRFGNRFKDGNQYVTPINLVHAAETYFLKAEGVWRGWNMGGGTAQSYYEKGIEISIKQWRGTSFSATEISNYVNSLATPVAPNNYSYNDPPASNIPVKFSTDRNKQYEQILTQKWIALFPISIEAFAEYRRTRLPKLYAKKYSMNSNVNPAIGQIVTRLPFVDGEKTTQPDEVAKAVLLLGGPDLETTPLWWDVNKN
jgi:hypothetical protein